MKCPVCRKELPNDSQQCPECTFDQLHRTFLNNTEYELWIKETVIPCRRVFLKCSNEFLQAGKLYNAYKSKSEETERLLGKILSSNDSVKKQLNALLTRNKEYFYAVNALCDDMHDPVDREIARGLLDNWFSEISEIISDIKDNIK